MIGSFGTQQPFLKELSKSHLININSVVAERGLLCITRHHLTFMALKAGFRNWDKGPSIITKAVLISLITQEILRVWEAVSSQPGTKAKYI